MKFQVPYAFYWSEYKKKVIHWSEHSNLSSAYLIPVFCLSIYVIMD